MRVLQINTTVNSGSTGRIAEDIGRVLIANGNESYIAYGRGNQKSESRLIKIGSQIDVNWHGVITLLTDRHGFASKRATKELVEQIEVLKPDVIGLHNIHGYYLNIEILFNYISKKAIPLIWTFHDCWPFTGHCTYFDSVNCEKWRTQCEKCPKTSAYPKSIGIDNSYKNYLDKKSIFNQIENLHIITPSNWLKQKVEESFLKTFPVTCIHNGIDLNQFKPIDNAEKLIEKWNLKEKKVILGVASIWDERKGLEDFIALSEKLTQEYQIILIGLNEKQIEAIPKKIIGVKRTENIAELVAYYNAATVFVNPTYQDNFPTTNIEALACGTPVITYNTGGSPEAINIETGEVIEKGDLEELAKVVIEWAQKNKQIMSKACRERAEHYFDKNQRYLDYLEIYKSMVNSLISNSKNKHLGNQK